MAVEHFGISKGKSGYYHCNVCVLPRCLEHYILSLGIKGSKSFLPLWHICNRAPQVWIKIIVYFLHHTS